MLKSTISFLAVAFVLPGASSDAFGQARAVPALVIEFAPAQAAIQWVVGNADGDENPQAAAMRAQFEPLVKIQLSFANRVCRWTKEQRVAAIAAANAWLDEYARESAKNNNRQQFAGAIMFINGDGPRGAGAAPPVEKKLQEKLQGAMTEEQRAEYDAQRAKRDAFRTEAAIDNIVAQMDRLLSLTPEQRRKVRDSLHESWKDNWGPQLEVFIHMTEYAPAFPDENVLPHLTPAQRDVWRGVQRISVQGVNFGGGGLGGNVPPIDDVDLREGQ